VRTSLCKTARVLTDFLLVMVTPTLMVTEDDSDLSGGEIAAIVAGSAAAVAVVAVAVTVIIAAM